jgi:hypothetical protein
VTKGVRWENVRREASIRDGGNEDEHWIFQLHAGEPDVYVWPERCVTR